MWRAFVFAYAVCVAAAVSAEADGTRISLGEDPAVTPDGSATLSMDGFNLRLVSFAFTP